VSRRYFPPGRKIKPAAALAFSGVAGCQRLPHVPPERRRRIRDLLGELVVGVSEVVPKVEAGDIRAPALPARVGHVTEDAGEGAQAVFPALERPGRQVGLAHGEVVQGGEGVVQVLVDGFAHGSALSSRAVAGESSALESSTITSRSSWASLPRAQGSVEKMTSQLHCCLSLPLTGAASSRQ
jgi:hypothetical protein